MTLSTEPGDMSCSPLKRMMLHFERGQKDLGIKFYQTWRLKAQDQAPSPLPELAASYLHTSYPSSFNIFFWKTLSTTPACPLWEAYAIVDDSWWEQHFVIRT